MKTTPMPVWLSLQTRAEEAVVPSLWWFEARNILVANERRGRVAESDTAAFLELAQREGIPLATLDADLRRAAAEAGVAVLSRAG